MKNKQQRISNLIGKILAEIVFFELKDPDLGLLTISDVEVTNDLSLAKVYVMVTGSKRQQEKSLAALDHAKGFIRKALAKELTTYKTPELRFIYDDSLDRASRIEELIKETHKE